MTTATTIITPALKAAGILGVGQVALQQDLADSLFLLNIMIETWSAEATMRVVVVALPGFPDLTTDVPVWTGKEAVLYWGLAARLIRIYGLPEDKEITQQAATLQALLLANNLQQTPAPIIARNDGTWGGLIYLALRAAGRVADNQGVAIASQDVSDAVQMVSEMLGEWQQDRTVTVTPGTFPPVGAVGDATGLESIYLSAVVLNLAVRIRSAFGLPEDKGQAEQAARAFARIQANNKQFQPSATPGATGTVLQLIYRALRVAGRINDQQGVNPASQDVSDAFAALVEMLAQWQRKRWLVPTLAEVTAISTGLESYSFGLTAPGQYGFTNEFTDEFVKNTVIGFLATRPDRIESAFARLINGGLEVDYPLEVLGSREDYNEIALKGLVSFPSQVFYDATFPLGTLYFWPIPPANQFELHVFVKSQLQQFDAVTDNLNAPPEYVEAMVYNLASRVCLFSGVPVRPDLANAARASLETVRNANIQVPLLQMPPGMPANNRRWGGLWFGGISTGVGVQ